MATARCTWTAVSGVDGYNVYLKSNGTFVKQNSELITDTVYDIENLEEGNYEAYATSVLNSVESDASNVKGFEVGVAFEVTDFSEYADTAAFLQEWQHVSSERTDAYISDSDITPEFGTKTLSMPAGSGGGSDQEILIWSEKGQYADGEILALIRTGAADSANTINIAFRASDTAKTFYRVGLLHSNNSIVLSRVQNGSNTAIATLSLSSTNNTWYWVRVSFAGTSIKAKAWALGASEPDWRIEETDSNLANGYVGLRVFSLSTSFNRFCDYFAVSNGETIPVP